MGKCKSRSRRFPQQQIEFNNTGNDSTKPAWASTKIGIKIRDRKP